ncbi:hypothetical protein [Pseudarthrobacter sulfonivorans]|uniref:hypothetical protein n=1 Tax=Pseudarthrobacter sulfonivorans TaxID=121292 RepID=UPI0027861182|nr:hypothetical protein [Pseudarthrobacter sulfonivorans]MDP9999938.1 23S rRNA maturation mini-RNase III [Pseudarthrobacter sulfonivorans]
MEAMAEQLAGNGSVSAVLTLAASATDECSRGGMPDAGNNVSASRQSIPMEAMTEQLTGNGSISAVQLRAASATDECSRGGMPDAGNNVSASRQSIPMEAFAEQLGERQPFRCAIARRLRN